MNYDDEQRDEGDLDAALPDDTELEGEEELDPEDDLLDLGLEEDDEE